MPALFLNRGRGTLHPPMVLLWSCQVLQLVGEGESTREMYQRSPLIGFRATCCATAMPSSAMPSGDGCRHGLHYGISLAVNRPGSKRVRQNSACQNR